MTRQVSDYTVWLSNGVIQYVRRSDGASIPPDPMNTDYQEFLLIDTAGKLCARQTIPTPPPPGPTAEQRIEALEQAMLVQQGLST